jgi:hypothetical protein
MAKKPGLYANIAAKKKRIAAGSKEKMRKPGTKGAPTAKNIKRAAKKAKKKRITTKGFVTESVTRLRNGLRTHEVLG